MSLHRIMNIYHRDRMDKIKSLVKWVSGDYMDDDYKLVQKEVSSGKFQGRLYKGIGWREFHVGDVIDIQYMTSWSTNEEISWNYEETGGITVTFPEISALSLADIPAQGEEKDILSEESEVIVSPCFLIVRKKTSFGPSFAKYVMEYMPSTNIQPTHIIN